MRVNAGYIIYRAIYEGVAIGLQQVTAEQIPAEQVVEKVADAAIQQLGLVLQLEDEQVPLQAEAIQVLNEVNQPDSGPHPPGTK